MVRRLFLTPPTLPTETATRCLVVPASKEWLGIFNAALLLATNLYNYEQVNDTDLTPDEVAAKCYEIYETYIREECTVCNCGGLPFGTQFRVNAEGAIEASTNGGVDWELAPEYDPRLTTALFRPLASGISDATKCAAAANATEAIRGIVETVETTLSLGGIAAGALLGALVIFMSAGVLAAFAAPLLSSVAIAGSSALNAAMTTEVYDALKCCLYCNFAEDGTLNNKQGLLDCINDSISGLANTVVTAIIELTYPNGLINMGRTGEAVGDECAECGCGCSVSQTYPAYGTDWTGDEGTNGVLGNGMYWGAGHPAPTFTIPDRAGRLIVAVAVNVGGGVGTGTVTVSAGATDSDESPFTWAGNQMHNFTPAVDEDVVTFDTSGDLSLWFNHVIVYYEC